MIRKIVSLLVVMCWLVIMPVAPAHAEQTLLITEVQVGLDDPTHEFIELYNPLASDLEVSEWRVEYLSASYSDTAPTPAHTISTLNGTIRAHSHVLLSYQNYLPGADVYFGQADASGHLAKTGGFVRVVNGQATSSPIDCVRWGGRAVAVHGCDRVAAAGDNDHFSIQRPLVEGAYYTGKVISQSPISPQAGGYLPAAISQPSLPGEGAGTPVELFCQNIELTEILPNPAGRDSGQEFIEIYNSSAQPQQLAGCSLRVGKSQYDFSDTTIEPHAYQALYSAQTKLSLKNSSGEVILIDSNDRQTAVPYPKLPPGHAWAKFDSGWALTGQPTPNATNQLSAPDGLKADVKAATGSAPTCPAGKYRHPETNRCRSLVLNAAMELSCPFGQQRNPLTNRCRSIVSSLLSANTLIPCKPQQERSTQTNRCRQVANVSRVADGKDCPAGQIRNPESNRCRKNPSSTNKAALVIKPSNQRSPWQGWAFGGAGLTILAYATYEYRQDLRQRWISWRQRSHKQGQTP